MRAAALAHAGREPLRSAEASSRPAGSLASAGPWLRTTGVSLALARLRVALVPITAGGTAATDGATGGGGGAGGAGRGATGWDSSGAAGCDITGADPSAGIGSSSCGDVARRGTSPARPAPPRTSTSSATTSSSAAALRAPTQRRARLSSCSARDKPIAKRRGDRLLLAERVRSRASPSSVGNPCGNSSARSGRPRTSASATRPKPVTSAR